MIVCACVCCFNIRDSNHMVADEQVQSHNYTSSAMETRRRSYTRLNVCQKAKTYTWTHKQKMIMCFCLPSFHLLVLLQCFVIVACLPACLGFSLFFSFYFFSVASSFSILISAAAASLSSSSFFLKCVYVFFLFLVESWLLLRLLLLLLRIKFRSTPCLWAWLQWPTTTGLLHIIPNSHTERLSAVRTQHVYRCGVPWCVYHSLYLYKYM